MGSNPRLSSGRRLNRMATRTFVIGTRGSTLARTQTEWVAARLREAARGLDLRVEIVRTAGDRDQQQPLHAVGHPGLFIRELEAALLDGAIDMAVHSLKDLPIAQPDGLMVMAVPGREDPRDALISAQHDSIEALPEGARVGTSSLRRKAMLLGIRPDLDVTPLRGNVDTRLEKVKDGAIDAAILAMAGLTRLGKCGEGVHPIAPDVMLPAPGQGGLAVECRADDAETRQLLQHVHDAVAYAETLAERSCLSALGGGCSTPLGALARWTGEELHLSACLCSPDGKTMLRAQESGALSSPDALGFAAVESLKRQGAQALLEKLS